VNIIYSAHIQRGGTLTYEEALALGYRTVGLGQRVWEWNDSEEQERTGRYRGFKGIDRARNVISYSVRFPGVHVVRTGHWEIFIVRVSSFADAAKLARKIGEGTVIQRIESKFRPWHYKERKGKRTGVAFGARGGGRRHGPKDTPYRYWIMRDGMLEETEASRTRIQPDD
jgi:hypothetical protein